MSDPPKPSRPISYNGFVLACRPDDSLRLLIGLLATLMLVAGLAVVSQLPFSGAVRGLLALAWTGLSLAEGWRWSRAARRLVALRLGVAGDWRGLDRNGIWQPLAGLPGSVVTRSVLWLRFRLPDGRLALLAFTPRSLPADGWRRLQAALRLPRG